MTRRVSAAHKPKEKDTAEQFVIAYLGAQCDGEYTIFGKVIEGMNVGDSIARAAAVQEYERRLMCGQSRLLAKRARSNRKTLNSRYRAAIPLRSMGNDLVLAALQVDATIHEGLQSSNRSVRDNLAPSVLRNGYG